MSIATILPLAFRCTKCWQLTCANSDEVGTSVPCVCCSTPVLVPEVTADRIKAGEEFAASSDSMPQAKINLQENISDEQIYQMARKNVDDDFKASGRLESRVCSRWKRLFGSIIDTVAGLGAVVAGFLVAAAMGGIFGMEDNPFIFLIMIGIPIFFAFYQCYLIASEGRSVGKYCVKTKIVGLDGKPPGFFQGIIMRIVVIGFLGLIPFFGLANICWIFNEPKRCLHDYIAGTFVIDA